MIKNGETDAYYSDIYVDHEVEPYISPDRNLGAWLVDPKARFEREKMELLQDSLLEGDIILLWRINFGNVYDRDLVS